jgi:hypothetical protein
MIKASFVSEGKPTVLLLGLSERNLEILRQGRPILFNGEPFGLPNTEIAIVWGETEQEILADLQAQGLLPNDLSELAPLHPQ